jgi:tetratricopeptide (TPR) repeat protein
MQVVDRRYDEAIASAKRAVALGPGDAEAQMALGYVQLFAGNHVEAATAVEKALRLDPNLSPIDREIAGLVFFVEGNATKAVETLERVRDDAPAVGAFRITLAAAYVRAGRLGDAQAAVTDGLRLTGELEFPAQFRSLSSWRISYAQFRISRDLDVILDALRQAGLPEWPFGFTADERDRLKGADISSLILGHTLQGQLEPGRQPAILQVGKDGDAGFRSLTRMFSETVYVDRDLLCEQSENMFGRPDCGPVYKHSVPAGIGYTFVNSGKVFSFTPVK